MTARIYPSQNSTGISFYADQPIIIKSLNKWDLKESI
ncbi:hypothetical protein [Alkalihalobacillus sp. BA299]|nr:hypothetical protein [Alkalihalobacillus sp. BA299]